jgi:hypothetical protein
MLFMNALVVDVILGRVWTRLRADIYYRAGVRGMVYLTTDLIGYGVT